MKRKQISKEEFYSKGGFANHKLFRKMYGDAWCYFELLD